MTPGVLVAGVGNLFFGDDGFGPEVVRRLIAPEADPLPADVRVVDYGIRGVHLLYDLLDGYEALVVVDALPGHGRPGETVVLQIGSEDLTGLEGAGDPHAMNPVAVLTGLPALGGRLPPAYVVGAHPIQLDEGIGLSEAMAIAVIESARSVRELLATRPWASAGSRAEAAEPSRAG